MKGRYSKGAWVCSIEEQRPILRKVPFAEQVGQAETKEKNIGI
jgi:hypothetical protein